LLRIIEDILDISKLEVGQKKVYESETRLRNLMSDIYEYYKIKLQTSEKKSEIALNLNFHSNLNNTVIFTDNQLLKQVLNNLIDNAIKFTKKGSIEIGCELKPDHELIFYVKDSGIGIEEDKLELIFDRFLHFSSQFRFNPLIKYPILVLTLSKMNIIILKINQF